MNAILDMARPVCNKHQWMIFGNSLFLKNCLPKSSMYESVWLYSIPKYVPIDIRCTILSIERWDRYSPRSLSGYTPVWSPLYGVTQRSLINRRRYCYVLQSFLQCKQNHHPNWLPHTHSVTVLDNVSVFRIWGWDSWENMKCASQELLVVSSISTSWWFFLDYAQLYCN